ncbi:RNA polymerase subunit sigma [Hallella colorans]|uniref:RNA polymerase subunit sigma n=1 Tax=Hallella colorans TaxID=1703337 RepID=UPI0023EF72CA|nr:RNA polymerase subunit sigma [Hallella colorans]
MDTYAKQVSDYLSLMTDTTLLVSEHDKANMDILITMLGEVDKDIICAYFGIFGKPKQTPDDIAAKYKITPQDILTIIEKDLRKIAITPEWQMMRLSFSPTIKRKLAHGIR